MSKNLIDSPLTTRGSKRGIVSDGIIDNLPEQYERPNQLAVPKAVNQRFKEQGYDLQWIRIYDEKGQLDVKNIRKKELDGYSFVKTEEVPEMNKSLISYFGETIDKYSDLIITGELALAKVPVKRITIKRKYNSDLTAARSKAILRDLRENRIGDAARGDVYTTERDAVPNHARQVDFSD